MRKQALMKSFLILLPLLAVGLATTGDSVVVFDTLAGTTEYYSYFDVLPVTEYQLLTPLAGMLSMAALVLAVVYLASKKNGSLKAAGIVAFLAAAIGVLPIIRSGDIKVVPNVGVPIMMLVEYILAYYMAKNKARLAQENKAPRLRK